MTTTFRWLAAGVCATAMLGAGVAAAQNAQLTPNYGTVALTSGFQPDPHRTQLQSGGPIDATRLGGGCVGFVTDAPDYRVNFTAGDGSLPLVFSVDSGADTTLVINGPDGRWQCNDDGGNRGFNPSVVFNRPTSGQYDVWVGTYGGATLQPATLEVSELYSQ